MLRIAIQKSGRLHDGSMQLLSTCGFDVVSHHNKLKATVSNFPIEILFLRDDDIPQYVADGVVQLGIVGQNVVAEKEKQLAMRRELGFGKCRLSIAVPRKVGYTGLQWLKGKRIATSYPNLVKRFLENNAINADIHEISGSVEIAPGMGLADAIVDLVSTGSTLFMNNLEEKDVVLVSQAVLISHSELSPSHEELVEQILFRIAAWQAAKSNKYIMMNVPDHQIENICSILPGLKGPSVLPLAVPGWSSLHTVINENDFWPIIAKLKSAGAEGILVLPIEKMIA